MNFKPVEMQIAMPRTTEMSHMQQNAQQKPAVEQHLAMQFAEKQAEVQRSSTEKLDQKSEAAIRDERYGSGKRDKAEKRRSGSKAQPQDGRASRSGGDSHPYKGRHIDLTL